MDGKNSIFMPFYHFKHDFYHFKRDLYLDFYRKHETTIRTFNSFKTHTLLLCKFSFTNRIGIHDVKKALWPSFNVFNVMS